MKNETWEDVNGKNEAIHFVKEHLGKVKLSDVLLCVGVGAFLLVGIWQAGNPIFKYPEERRR